MCSTNVKLDLRVSWPLKKYICCAKHICNPAELDSSTKCELPRLAFDCSCMQMDLMNKCNKIQHLQFWTFGLLFTSSNTCPPKCTCLPTYWDSSVVVMVAENPIKCLLCQCWCPAFFQLGSLMCQLNSHLLRGMNSYYMETIFPNSWMRTGLFWTDLKLKDMQKANAG